MHPDVVRIRYSLKEDWTGDPSIFFRVVLSDEASHPDRLSESTGRVQTEVLRQVNPLDIGLLYYFNYRSLSETRQRQFQDPDWE